MAGAFNDKVELFDVPYAPGYSASKKQRKYRRLSLSTRHFIERVKTGTAYLAMQLGRLVTDTLAPLPFATKSRKWVNLDTIRVNKLMNMRLHGMPLVTYATSTLPTGLNSLGCIGKSASSFDIAGMEDESTSTSSASSSADSSFIGAATTCNVCLPLDLKRTTNRDGDVENPDGPLVGKNLCFGWWKFADESNDSDFSYHCGWNTDFFAEHKIETALTRVQSALAVRGYNLIDATDYLPSDASGTSNVPIHFEFRIELISPPWKKFPPNTCDGPAAAVIAPVIATPVQPTVDDGSQSDGNSDGAYDQGSDYDDDDEDSVEQETKVEPIKQSSASTTSHFEQRSPNNLSKTASVQDWRVAPSVSTASNMRRRSPPNHQDPRYRRTSSEKFKKYVEQPTIPSHIAKMSAMNFITGKIGSLGDRVNRPQPLITTNTTVGANANSVNNAGAGRIYLHPNSRKSAAICESYPSSPDSSAALTSEFGTSGRMHQCTPCSTPDLKPTSPLSATQGTLIDLPNLHGEWELIPTSTSTTSNTSTASIPTSSSMPSRQVSGELQVEVQMQVASTSTTTANTTASSFDSPRAVYLRMCAQSRHSLVTSLDTAVFP